MISIKRFLPRGLLGRSLLIIVIPLVVLQIVMGIIFYDRHWANVSRHRAISLAGDIAIIIRLLREEDGSLSQEDVIAMAGAHFRIYVEVLPSGPGVDGSFEPKGLLETTLAAALNAPFSGKYIIDTKTEPNRIVIWGNFGDGLLRVSVDNERLISSTTRIFILWMVGAAIILFAVATIFMRNQVRPLRRLARAAESFGKGHTQSDFQPSGATEVRQAAAAFLAMRERIRRQIQQRTVMLAGVSHDLRTPLTRMKLQLAMHPNQEDAEAMQNDIAEMENMIAGYLDFVRGEGTEETQDTRVDALIEEVASNARIQDKEIAVAQASGTVMPLRRDAFKRCLTNLVTNGLRHGATRVEIATSKSDSHLDIFIDDNGPGIPADAREEVFRPFYRLDNSRNLDTGGTGLGLSIAQDIVHGHGGEITLDDSPLGGLRARIRLPI